jgi:uncharacterized membrane protein YphA (DoxX/SURF4 family)
MNDQRQENKGVVQGGMSQSREGDARSGDTLEPPSPEPGRGVWIALAIILVVAAVVAGLLVLVGVDPVIAALIVAVLGVVAAALALLR